MKQHSERLVRNERRNSLAALLRAIKFRKPGGAGAAQRSPVEQHFARPTPRARQQAILAEDSLWVRSAN